MASRSLRNLLAGFFVFTILGVLGLSYAAPPRVHHPRPRALRPNPARVYRHVRPVAKPVVKRRRIATYRPVVVSPYSGSGGVVVIQDSGSTSAEPAEESSNIEITPVPSQADTVSESVKVQASDLSDTNKDFAGQPSYEIVRLEDDGMTAVIQIEGQETKVRMIGVAEMAQGKQAEKGKNRPSVTQHFMENMLKGEKVYVVYDSQVEETDEDGKYVAYLYRAPDGLLVNLEAIRLGFGVADTSYDFDDKETFQFYNDKARRLGKGVWGRRQGGRKMRDDDRRPRPGPRPGI